MLDSSQLKKWIIELPAWLDDSELSSHAIRLYLRYKRLASEGYIRESVRESAKHCGLKVGEIAAAKKELTERGIINNGGDSIILADLWPKNFHHCYQGDEKLFDTCKYEKKNEPVQSSQTNSDLEDPPIDEKKRGVLFAAYKEACNLIRHCTPRDIGEMDYAVRWTLEKYPSKSAEVLTAMILGCSYWHRAKEKDGIPFDFPRPTTIPKIWNNYSTFCVEYLHRQAPRSIEEVKKAYADRAKEKR